MTDHPLANAHVLVVGGTGMLGQAIVGRVASDGARVTLTSRTAESAERAAAQHDGLPVTGVAYDLTDHSTVSGLIAAGPFDHVVISASSKAFDSLVDISADDLDALVATKFTGIMWTARHLHPQIDQRGSLVLLSGMLSRRPTGSAPMAAVSGGIESLGLALAHEWAPVRVNVVSPGAIGSTGVGDHAGAPGDVAGIIAHVLANRFINGTVLDIHGGMA